MDGSYIMRRIGMRTARIEQLAPHGTPAIATACGVSSRRIRAAIANGLFPETPYWRESVDGHGHRRRFSDAQVDATHEIACELRSYGRPRWDRAALSNFGDRVAAAWYRSEQSNVDPAFEFCGRKGWADANPIRGVIDYSTPEAVRAAEVARMRALQKPDEPVIDLTTREGVSTRTEGNRVLIHHGTGDYRQPRRLA
jgi:hypothetical protein